MSRRIMSYDAFVLQCALEYDLPLLTSEKDAVNKINLSCNGIRYSISDVIAMSKTKEAYRQEVELEVLGKKKILVLTAPPFDASKFKPAKFPKSVTRELLISLVTE